MIHYRPRLRYHRRGLLEIARLSTDGPSWHAFWATSAAASALASAPSSTCSPQPHRLPHLLSAGPKQAKSRKTHSSQPVARGFGLRGLSGAYRQPKLFTVADGQLISNKEAIAAGSASARSPLLPQGGRREDDCGRVEDCQCRPHFGRSWPTHEFLKAAVAARPQLNLRVQSFSAIQGKLLSYANCLLRHLSGILLGIAATSAEAEFSAW